ncbi:DUF2399 domain-containing protein [Lutibacter sp. B2]|nr:DUF2399 domain-containing protein [Lutibacter sp. B2]
MKQVIKVEKKIRIFLKNYKKMRISLNELEKIFSGDITYETFAKEILKFEEKGILKEVKTHKRNNKPISLANSYTINKSFLREKQMDEIQRFQLQIHPKIQLQSYYSLAEVQWKNDFLYIEKINKYLKDKGLPNEEATSAERSFHLVGDEKWMDEKGGRKIIERLGIWQELKINNVPDPLMLAVNPTHFSKSKHMHLIVENKTTYYALLEVLQETNYTSLIYGAGWKIISGISMLEEQLSLHKKEHKLYYFGDLDFEGISIWNRLNEKRSIDLAIDFYRELLKKSYSKGKETQKKNEQALGNFLSFFNHKEQEQIKSLLEIRGYYPQEALTKEEVKSVWRKELWSQT